MIPQYHFAISARYRHLIPSVPQDIATVDSIANFFKNWHTNLKKNLASKKTNKYSKKRKPADESSYDVKLSGMIFYSYLFRCFRVG
jgi:hypothetical protein